MSDISPFILAASDGTLSNSRVLATGTGLTLQDTGAEGTLTISPTGNLNTLSTFNSPGLLTYDSGSSLIAARQLTAGAGISLTAAGGQGANPQISVVTGSTVQKVNVIESGNTLNLSSRSELNFIPSGSVSITLSDNSADNRADIRIDAPVAADVDAKYIIQTADSGLPNAQSLGTLSTGLLKVTTTSSTGVLSTAVADTDYQAASANLTSISNVTHATGTMLVGNGTGFGALAPSSTVGTVLTSNGTGLAPTYQAPATGNLVFIVPLNGATAYNLTGNTTYITFNTTGPKVVFTLPTAAAAVPGTFYTIVGGNQVGWKVAQNVSQNISLGPLITTVGTGGSIESTTTGQTANESVTIWCMGPTYFVISSVVGTIQFT